MPQLEVERRVVDGCTAFLASEPSPIASCGLVISAGTVDETLARSGWLWLLLESARVATATPEVDVTVRVDHRVATVVVHGPTQQAAELLTSFCRVLPQPAPRELPRLHASLAANLAGRHQNALSQSLFQRFGVRSLGLSATPYYGQLRPTSYAGISQAAYRWFARENCRLFFTFDPPSGWTHALPPGPRLRTAAPDVQVSVPGWLEGVGDIIASGVATRSDAARMFTELARRDLQSAFSDPTGESSGPSAAYLPFTAEQTVIALRLNQNGLRPARIPELMARLDGWQRGFAVEELDALRAIERERLAAAPTPLEAVQAAALTDLDEPPGEVNYFRPRWQQVSNTQLCHVARQFNQTLLVGVTDQYQAAATRLPASLLPTRYVTDLPERHRSINHPVDERIAGVAEGRLWIADEAYPASSVSLDRLAVLFGHPDGALTLLDDYGQRLEFDPRGWRDGVALRDHLLAITDPALHFEGRRRSAAEQQATGQEMTTAGKAAGLTAKRLTEAQWGHKADFVEMLIALSCVLPLAAGIVAIEAFGVSPALGMGLGIPLMFALLPVVIIVAKRRRKVKWRARAKANQAELRDRRGRN